MKRYYLNILTNYIIPFQLIFSVFGIDNHLSLFYLMGAKFANFGQIN